MIKAFPTAEGHGALTIGGRGGKVIFVENNADDGPGSYRAALKTSGPRYVIPLVSGTCTLKSMISAIPPFVTVAFQTSPNGFQIKGSQNPLIADGTIFSYEQVIVRDAKIRQGGPGMHDGGVGMILYSTDSATRLKNAIFDHISYTWGIDAPMQAYGYGDDITFQECIIANGADNENTFASNRSSGNKGDQTNITGKISILRSLYANNGSRNPLMQQAALFDFRNNVVYNWNGNNGGQFGEYPLNQRAIGNIVGNVYLMGMNSAKPAMVLSYGAIAGGSTKVYALGNIGPNRPTNTGDEYADIFEIDSYWKYGGPYGAPVTAAYKASTPYPAPNTTTLPTEEVLAYVLRNAGARFPSLDAADQAVLESVINRSGNIAAIGSGGPWPIFVNESPPLDTNKDGCPDLWNNLMGYGPSVKIANLIDPSTGYPYLETYLNWRAGDYPEIDLLPDPIVLNLESAEVETEVEPDNVPVYTAGIGGEPSGLLILAGMAALLWLWWSTKGSVA